MSGANGWENVYIDASDRMDRRRADHGWLYRNMVRQGSEHAGYTWTMALTYEADPPAPAGTRAKRHESE